MTSARHRDVEASAARAALAVPGVAALQPGLADRLATAAARAQRAAGATTLPSVEPGIRAEHTPDGGWRVEVRCVVDEEHRVLDVAQQVRARVRATVIAHLAQHGPPAPVTVLVTVTHTG
ncbi:hypothetical protein HUT18_29775 [Streptomyces sp. NA04227]|uniref:hypothetical protein n=1 Tax=Streptomyces sp. NA04227 TaxID=2742136 RepID=UPI0015921FB0|nr:hypothetical protein [Streptomyces sp. NA04227]QKW09983.1 hypothetical protein HUT18_29775 [Streptomyces sp. NA04227]